MKRKCIIKSFRFLNSCMSYVYQFMLRLVRLVKVKAPGASPSMPPRLGDDEPRLNWEICSVNVTSSFCSLFYEVKKLYRGITKKQEVQKLGKELIRHILNTEEHNITFFQKKG